MAEVVNKTVNSDRLYVHKIAAIDKKGNPLLTFKAGASELTANPDSGSPNIISILQEIIKSKPKNQKRDVITARTTEKERAEILKAKEITPASY